MKRILGDLVFSRERRKGLSELIARQNRLQRSLRFKVIASIVVAVCAIGAWTTYFVAVTSPADTEPKLADALLNLEDEQVEVPEGVTLVQGASRPALESVLRRVDELRTARENKLNVAMGIGVGAGVLIAIVWLGLALTYLEVLLAAGAIQLLLYGWQRIFPLSDISGARALANVLVGSLVLAWSFTAIIESLRLLFGALPGNIFAISRNTVVEAVRMKVSLIFIVLLIFGLASLPGMLNEDSPLRYRVQSFLQYGTSGAFWIIAVLTLFFSVATVAFEQRDRQIWQTMTKPVASWQYLLGKWLGVVSVSASLLVVSATGVFMFTEYLRAQPAVEEEARLAAGVIAPSQDREILETQVLVARTTTAPNIPAEIARNGRQFQEAFAKFIEDQRIRDPEFAKDPAERQRIESDLAKNAFLAWRTIEPGSWATFVFDDLEQAASTNSPVVLRYRIDAGSNSPDDMFTLTFHIQDNPYVMRETGLGHMHSMTIAPMIEVPHEGHLDAVLMDDPEFYNIIAQGRMINGKFVLPGGAVLREVKDVVKDGEIRIDIINGDIERQVVNSETVNLPSGGLELTYAVGSYRMNYMRTIIVLWLKLAFLSMLAITCATFLSFPVACLVAFGTFLAAESAGFLNVSLEYYDELNYEGDVVIYKYVVKQISYFVGWLFKFYADLKPTQSLVDGKLVAWPLVGAGALFLGLWSLLLYAFGVMSFRRRELAMYSGQ